MYVICIIYDVISEVDLWGRGRYIYHGPIIDCYVDDFNFSPYVGL